MDTTRNHYIKQNMPDSERMLLHVTFPVQNLKFYECDVCVCVCVCTNVFIDHETRKRIMRGQEEILKKSGK
jgi:hypothetical protein